MLSDRQLLILKLKEQGKTHSQISAELGLSLHVISNESARAQRKLSLPSESYERFVSKRTAGVLRSKFGPGTVTPAEIKKYISGGQLSVHPRKGLMFNGVRIAHAGEKTFHELSAYAELDKAQRLQPSKIMVFPLPISKEKVKEAIVILKREGYKIKPP